MLSLADAIINEDIASIRQFFRYGVDVNQFDQYGFTPLIEAAIVDNIEIAQYLLEQGANPNQPDVTGGTALHWAAENNNIELCQLLLKYRANPNSYNLSGQPVLVMPMLRGQKKLSQFLIRSGADQTFAQDFINVKLLGHMFELVGPATIVDPKNNFVEVDFEGFFLEVTIGLIADSLMQFQNHFAARNLRRYSGLARFVVTVMRQAGVLIKYQQYRNDVKKVKDKIEEILNHDPMVIPVGYEGHAITFIKSGNFWVKCDRREDSRLYDNVMFYRVRHVSRLTPEFLQSLIYEKHSSEFINEEIDAILGLEPFTELKVEAQISGNCSWANVEAVIPAVFLLELIQSDPKPESLAFYKSLALNFFHRWREWNKTRALDFCMQSFMEGDAIRKACKAEILAAVLFQRCDMSGGMDRGRINQIVNLLINSPYHYVLKNYLRVYLYDNYTEEGKLFGELLKEFDYPKDR